MISSDTYSQMVSLSNGCVLTLIQPFVDLTWPFSPGVCRQGINLQHSIETLFLYKANTL